MGLVSGWSWANHSNSVFPGGTRIAQPRWMLARGILGSGRTCSVSFRPFPNSSSWWWLISSIFLTRISCHKQLVQMVTMVPGQGGRFQCASPNNSIGYSRKFRSIFQFQDQLISNFNSVFTIIPLCPMI